MRNLIYFVVCGSLLWALRKFTEVLHRLRVIDVGELAQHQLIDLGIDDVDNKLIIWR